MMAMELLDFGFEPLQQKATPFLALLLHQFSLRKGSVVTSDSTTKASATL